MSSEKTNQQPPINEHVAKAVCLTCNQPFEWKLAWNRWRGSFWNTWCHGQQYVHPINSEIIMHIPRGQREWEVEEPATKGGETL